MGHPRGRSCYGGNDDVVRMRFVLVVSALVACSVAGYQWLEIDNMSLMNFIQVL